MNITRELLHKFDQKQDPAIRTDLLKLIYTCMLHCLDSFKLHEFLEFTIKPLLPVSSALETTEFLWKNQYFLPTSSYIKLLETIEPFLNENGINLNDFSNMMLYEIGKGTPFSPYEFLNIARIQIDSFYLSDFDPRTFLIKNIDKLSAFVAPFTPHFLVKLETSENKNNAIIALALDKFNGKIGSFDCYTWIAQLIKSSPISFGYPEFENLQILSDCRKIKDILTDIDFRLDFDGLFIKDKKYGEIKNFHDILENKKINLPDIPNCKVVWIESDYFCSKRNRIILHEGCAYEANIYLYKLLYEPINFKNRIVFEKLIDEFVNENSIWNTLENKHKALQKLLSTPLHFSFNKKDQIITVNTKYLMKGVPAKIFAQILYQHCEFGKTEFYIKDFIKNSDFITEPSNPNFAIRLQRILQALQKHCPGVTFSRLERGKLFLKKIVPLSFSEE